MRSILQMAYIFCNFFRYKGACLYMGNRAIKPRIFCSFPVVFLAFLWSTGLIYGVYLGGKDLSVVSLMRLYLFSQVSIVGLIFVLILPLLITIASVRYGGRIAIYIISMIQGVSIGYTLSAASATFGKSAWLVYILLFFSEFFLSIVLLWFLFRRANRPPSRNAAGMQMTHRPTTI